MHPVLKIYSAFSRFGFIVLLLLGVFTAGQLIYVDGWVGFTAVPVISLVLWFFYMLWWAPLLVVTEQALVAFNVWRKVRVPWSEFIRAKGHLGLVFETTAGDFRLSAAQPKNRLRELRHPEVDPVPHVDFSAESVSLHLHTQQAVELLNEWKQLHVQHDKLAGAVSKGVSGGVSDSAVSFPEGGANLSQVTVSYMWHHLVVLAGLLAANLGLLLF